MKLNISIQKQLYFTNQRFLKVYISVLPVIFEFIQSFEIFKEFFSVLEVVMLHTESKFRALKLYK